MINKLILAFLLFAASFSPACARAWQLAETDHFRIYTDGKTDELKRLVNELEDFHALLLQMTGAPADLEIIPLDIYLLDDGDRQSLKMGAGTMGLYSANTLRTAAVSRRALSSVSLKPQEILFHEYAHHFMLQYFPFGYPDWYVEGFASYFSTVVFEDGKMRVGRTPHAYGYFLKQGSWQNFEDLLRGGEDGKRYGFYQQGWALTHWLFRSSERSAAIADYFTAIQQGEDRLTAFQDRFNLPPVSLASKLRAYFRSDEFAYTEYPLTREKRDISVSILDAASDDLLLRDLMFSWRPYAIRDEVDYLSDTLKIVGKYPQSAYAQRVAARGFAMTGDTSEARARLKALVEENPENAEIHYLEGVTWTRDADALQQASTSSVNRERETGEQEYRLRAKARAAYGRAFALDPSHAPTLFKYVLDGRDFSSENALNILATAHNLAPQVQEISIAYASGLLQAGDTDASHALLLPVASFLHRPGTALAADHLLALEGQSAVDGYALYQAAMNIAEDSQND